MLAMGLGTAARRTFESFPFLNAYYEAQMHHHEYKRQGVCVGIHESIKKRLKKSPDIFDSLMGFGQLKHEVVMEWGESVHIYS